MHQRNPRPQTRLQHLTAMQHDRQNIPQRLVQRVIASIRRRCQAVIRVRGGQN